jgi:micrococcal nuclease
VLPAIFGVVAAAAVGTAVVIAVSEDTIPEETAVDQAVVTHVVDGDTFDVSIEGRTERVRMLNIDTPETKDPNQAVQCLGPEASAFLASLIPVGTTVRLEYDKERTDPYQRTLAGVFTADGTLVNAEVARAGLARAVVFGRNDRFLSLVQAAQQDASAHGRGLYSPDVACTLPGQVKAVTDAVAKAPAASSQPVTASSTELETAANDAAVAVATATALRDAFYGNRHGIVWDAFSLPDQERFSSRVTSAWETARHEETTLRAAATTAKDREAEAARITKDAEAARVAEEQRVAAEAEASRNSVTPANPIPPVAKPVPRPAPAPAPNPTPAPAPAPGTNPYSGYTGPRCYAPGGKTWKPCP